jgi:hypothetical protein
MGAAARMHRTGEKSSLRERDVEGGSYWRAGLVHRCRNRINDCVVGLMHDEPAYIDQIDGNQAG